MSTKDKTKRCGSLCRTMTVTVRMDPRLQYLAGLAARTQRRTLSSFIEGSITESLKGVPILQDRGSETDSLSVADAAENLWSVSEPKRLVLLAIHYPHLLTFGEQESWKSLQRTPLFEPAKKRVEGRITWDSSVLENEVFPKLHEV